MNKKIDISRNNLDRSLSPYLRQHEKNPIHWQEWSQEILDIAQQHKKKIFVSIGYSTCHWCHVMAQEAFSNQQIAKYLNQHFLSIKVDREQRPDIDQYFMTFIQKTTGSGGWPLNVFLSPDVQPIFACTYIPMIPRYGMPGMLDLLKSINNVKKGVSFTVTSDSEADKESSLASLIQSIVSSYDSIYGGFGFGNKFPSPSTLLFLLSYYERYSDEKIKNVIEHTLSMMMNRGLHDHLQGGFFRYCIDRNWTIPHFEKMLYDQAMLLWTYSWAYKILKHQAYRSVINGIVKCLKDTFLEKGLYVAAHDADTEHIEGATYLWDFEELKDLLHSEELSYLMKHYEISEKGNFEKSNHLIKKTSKEKGMVEEKLMHIRNKRIQPFTDKKVITSWNALTGIGYVMAWRSTDEKSFLNHAENIFKHLIQKHLTDDIVVHSSLDGKLQRQGYLEDAASLLLLATFLYEEKKIEKEILIVLNEKVNQFHDGTWFDSNATDFLKIPAHDFDHPIPSSLSLVNLALVRYMILSKKEYHQIKYRQHAGNEIYNLYAFITQGHWHIIHNTDLLPWNKVSSNTIQVKDSIYSDCFEGSCFSRTSTSNR
ncbi:MAG: thioredoxin domain-containing protein [Candidatus Thermoplasmatota archaeon]|nr:thioredoxin domain-containing protein [Candidatus Thermoplasmatota archaeon]